MSDIHSLDGDLFTVHDLLAWKPPPTRHIVWDGVLDAGHRLQIFGDEGSWKSMSAIHLAYSIANGTRWMGFHTSPATVLYIQGEMGRVSVRNRMEKYCNGTKNIYLAKPLAVPAEAERADKLAYPASVITQVIQFIHLDEQAGISSLRRKVDIIFSQFPNQPLVIILDPLYKMFHHDLTVAKEVSYFCENMDLLLYDYNTYKNGVQRQLALVFVHHSRKFSTDKDGNRISSGSEESFGAKQLAWWSDTVLNTCLNGDDETKTTVDYIFTKHGRDSEGTLPKLITVRWNKETLHPRILRRLMPSYPEDEIEARGTGVYEGLE